MHWGIGSTVFSPSPVYIHEQLQTEITGDVIGVQIGRYSVSYTLGLAVEVLRSGQDFTV